VSVVEEIFSENNTSILLNIHELFANISACKILGLAVSTDTIFEILLIFFPAKSCKLHSIYESCGVVDVSPKSLNFKRNTLSFVVFQVSHELGTPTQEIIKSDNTILVSTIDSLIVTFKASIFPFALKSIVSTFTIVGGVESIRINGDEILFERFQIVSYAEIIIEIFESISGRVKL
jgi:hypothetical protein